MYAIRSYYERYPIRKVNQLLETTRDLLKKNIVYSTPSTEWKSNNNNWRLTYDGTTLLGVFPDLELTCLSKNDSIKIFDTKGTFNYNNNIWNGERGKVTWERAGFSRDTVYAVFNNYEVPFRDAGFEVDSVTFYNTIYFERPLKGRLAHKVMNSYNFV